MTLAELSRHFKLRERIERNNETIAGLRLAAYPGAQKLDGIESFSIESFKTSILFLILASSFILLDSSLDKVDFFKLVRRCSSIVS